MKAIKARFTITAAALLLGAVMDVTLAQTPASDTRVLVRQADFVGFVLTNPVSTSSTGEWRQFDLPTVVEPIKNTLPKNPGGNPYPYISSDHFPASHYPTWFPETGEYLVFLKRGTRNGQRSWDTIAAFQVRYKPGPTGQIVGAIFGDSQDRTDVSKAEAHAILTGVLSKTSTDADVRPLDIVFQHAAATAARQEFRIPVSYEERFAEVQSLAAAIRLGTARSDVEKVFPQQDGGLMAGTTRYVMGSEVMVEVPYDNTGGIWKPDNHVNGLVHVYRSRPHPD